MAWCLLLFASLASAQFFDYRQKHSSKVDPCDDFTKFVCAEEQNSVQDLFRIQHWTEFETKIKPLVFNHSEPGLDRIKNLLYAQRKDDLLRLEGRKVGVSAARNEHDVVTVDSTEFGPSKTFQVVVDKRGETRRPTEQCILEKCPVYIQGIVAGYKSVIDMKKRISLKTTILYCKSLKFPTIELTGDEERNVFETYFDATFPAYANAITVKMAVKNGLYLTKQGKRRAERMMKELRTGMAKKFKNLKWLSNREEIAKYLDKDIRVVFGIAQEFVDHPEYLDEMLAFYEKEVQRNFLHEKKKRFGDFVCGLKVFFTFRGCLDVRCKVDVLNKVLVLAMKRYTNLHPDRENFSNMMMREMFEPFSVNTFGGYNPSRGVLTIHPGTILLLNNLNLPDGLVYGTVGYIMAHELFHSVDFGQTGKMDIYHKNARSQKAEKCLSDFYGSFPFVNGSHVLFEDGTLKLDEGFADIEGARLIVKILTDRRAAYGRKKRAASVSSFSDVEWFFFGVAKIGCSRGKESEQAFLQHSFGLHPRMSIRFNAIMLQTPEFSKYFRCRKGDNMYRVDNQCQPFPLK
ncbi:hypothetical protein QR680_008679 [Steinernema hermaphroditum]|uniref:Peptidase M13 C-terminal domain-containing protein n=1 Tax=Steinernema hermaphroditum TaxID=289476 RepID=A0AA39IJG4_9BILA|nr:hypothetical protein QR680_008679 [Steinernema hermaphroditum]